MNHIVAQLCVLAPAIYLLSILGDHWSNWLFMSYL